ncbi:hypothetical protein K9L97_06075, partial [Candidatus Woesearchaeota archaeon]|nr:hypothetical protein [Candidatus Woesearchaeota archaeon]
MFIKHKKINGYFLDSPCMVSDVGKIIDDEIKNNLLGKNVVIQAISTQERSETYLDTIKKLVLSDIKGCNYSITNKSQYSVPNADIFGVEYEIAANSVIAENFMKKFIEVPKKYGCSPLRIDIFSFYDSACLERIEKDIFSESVSDAFKFKGDKDDVCYPVSISLRYLFSFYHLLNLRFQLSLKGLFWCFQNIKSKSHVWPY